MKITFELNGLYRLKLRPEDDLEKLFLDKMTEDSTKGKTTKFFQTTENNVPIFMLDVER